MRFVVFFLAALLALVAGQCTKTSGTYYICADSSTYVKCSATTVVAKWYCPECVAGKDDCSTQTPPIRITTRKSPDLPGCNASHNVGLGAAGEPGGPAPLKVVDNPAPWPAVWVPMSAIGQVAKISTKTSTTVQKFYTWPTNNGASNSNPSRTTVDLHGSVWVGNRDDNGCYTNTRTSQTVCGTVTHIGLLEAGQCVDRNKNGVIDTSKNFSHILPWTIPSGGAENVEGTPKYASDECILHYLRMPYGYGLRHISITPDNNVWIGSWWDYWGSNHQFAKCDSTTGKFIAGTQFTSSCGGYGGVTSSTGIVGSAQYPGTFMIYTPGASSPIQCISMPVYGVTLDRKGTFWGGWDTTLTRIHANGTKLLIAAVPSGHTRIRGLACDKNQMIWMGMDTSNEMARFNATSKTWIFYYLYVKNAGYCVTPIGVSIDDQGFLWTPCQSNGVVSRVDPSYPPSNPKFTYVTLTSGSGPYTYSDMTGFISLNSMKPWGLWQFTIDSKLACTQWTYFWWDGKVPKGGEMSALAAWSESATAPVPSVTVTSGKTNTNLLNFTGRYLNFEMRLAANPALESPSLTTFMYKTHDYTLPLITGTTAAVACNSVTLTLSLPTLTCGTWSAITITSLPVSTTKSLPASTTSTTFSGLFFNTAYQFFISGVHSTGQTSPIPQLVTVTTPASTSPCSCTYPTSCGSHGTLDGANCKCVCASGWGGPLCDVDNNAGLLSSSEYKAGSTNVNIVSVSFTD
ncbi:DNA-binding beta-propeller fold protein YncE [Pelomyxa schiedti]|nr:DNA-binding beta-propeller fold protein YncE [Pelomyxa schiedti]